MCEEGRSRESAKSPGQLCQMSGIDLQPREVWLGADARACGAAQRRAALSTPGMGDRLGVKVPWRKR
jgi:hypothetical protein